MNLGMTGWRRRYDNGGLIKGDETSLSDYKIAMMTPTDAAICAQSVGQHKGNQASGVTNGLAYAKYDADGNLEADNVYTLDDVVAKGPDLRIAKSVNGGRNILSYSYVEDNATNNITDESTKTDNDNFAAFPDWVRRIFGPPSPNNKSPRQCDSPTYPLFERGVGRICQRFVRLPRRQDYSRNREH